MKKRTKIIYFILFSIAILFTGFVLYLKFSSDVSKKTLNNDNYVKSDVSLNMRDKNPEIVKLKDLQKLNSDTKAILKIDNTNIYYPVMQSGDNKFYLRRNINKSYDINGSIFLDYECNLNSSENLIIYGHNMSSKNMFSDLVKYKDKDFFNNHKYITLYTDSGVRQYYVEGVYVMDLTKESTYDFNLFINSSYTMNAKKYVDLLNKYKVYGDDIEVYDNSRIITLSTCSYETDNARTVVIGIEI